MKFAFVDAEKARFPVVFMCSELEISTSGYYAWRGRPPPGLIHHSDRGSQYASGDYRRALDVNKMLCSMSSKGDCWDNAVA